jgi:hypothetical protein
VDRRGHEEKVGRFAASTLADGFHCKIIHIQREVWAMLLNGSYGYDNYPSLLDRNVHFGPGHVPQIPFPHLLFSRPCRTARSFMDFLCAAQAQRMFVGPNPGDHEAFSAKRIRIFPEQGPRIQRTKEPSGQSSQVYGALSLSHKLLSG